MEKSFYQAETPDQALSIYYQGEDEMYAKVINKTIKKVLETLYEPGHWLSLKILEIGSAGGFWTDYFLKKGAQLTCVDISTQVLEGNKKMHPQANFIFGDATDTKLDEEFNFIFVKDVIEHIENDEQFLHNMFHHSKEGGYILVNTQNSLSLNYAIQGGYHYLKGNKKWYGWDPTHVRFYNYFNLNNKLKNNGFIPIKYWGSYYFPYRLLMDRFHSLGSLKAFALIELMGLYDKFPFNLVGWNLGVIAKKK